MNYLDAKAQCESDGAYLAIPRSDAENAFIASLIPKENIWIGINDIDEEGTFKAVDGGDVSYTKWLRGAIQNDGTMRNEPDNWRGNEDGVVILSGYPDAWNGFWGDGPITNQYKFVCMYNIKFDYSGKF